MLTRGCAEAGFVSDGDISKALRFVERDDIRCGVHWSMIAMGTEQA
jgi:hypothetical protein